MIPPYRSHEDKMLVVLSTICDKSQWWTRLKIARNIGYRASRTIAPALEDLLQRGLIEQRETPRPNGQVRFEYRGTIAGCDKLEQLRLEGFL